MLAQELIEDFTAAGVQLSALDGKLAYEGPRDALIPERIEMLRRHKLELLAALTTPGPDLDAFEERAAICEYDGGLERARAEQIAAEDQGYGTVIDFMAALRKARGEGGENGQT